MTFHQSSSNFGLFQHVICLKYSKFYEEFKSTIRFHIGSAKLKLFHKTVIKTSEEADTSMFVLMKNKSQLFRHLNIPFQSIFREEFNGAFGFSIHSAKLELFHKTYISFFLVLQPQ